MIPHLHPPAQRRRPRHRVLAALMLSLVLMLAIGAAVGMFFTDTLVRYTFMHRLCSADEDQRRGAIAYVVRRVDDPRVVDHARRRLATVSGECLDATAEDLAAAGVWGHQFGSAYLRHLHRRLDEADADQRAGAAVTLARTVFERRQDFDDPQVIETLDRLLADEQPIVRLNALSAAAVLDEPGRTQRITMLKDDPSDAVADRAVRMLRLLEGGTEHEPTNPAEAAAGQELQETLRQLAELESLPDASVDDPPALDRDTPPLIRLHTVRVSREADPLDLAPVFRSEQPTLRDLATVIALQRFDPAQRHELARELIGSYADPPRWAGVLLAAMSEPDDDLRERIRIRFDNATDWVSRQHYRLALHMAGELDEPFDPTRLLLHRAMPRTTLIMAMLHSGDPRGLDWLLRPLGTPGVGSVRTLRVLMDTARYHQVIAHYLPDASPFDPWADAVEQHEQVETLRDWYLLHRHALRFDEAERRFRLRDSDPY